MNRNWLLWKSCFQAGKLQQAKEVAKKYLHYCKNRKLCEEGLDFVDQLKKSGALANCQDSIELEILRGNKKALTPRLAYLKQLMDEGNMSEEADNEFERYRNLMEKKWGYWKSEDAVIQSCLKSDEISLKKGLTHKRDAQARKKIISLAFDSLLKGRTETFSLLERYARAFRNKAIASALLHIRGESCSLDKKDISKYAEIKSISNASFLLQDNPSGLSEIKRLENNIKFLIKSQGIESAHAHLLKLQQMEPDNPLVQEHLNKKQAPEKNLEEILREIQIYTSSKKPSRPSGGHILTGIPDSELIKNAEDVIIGLISMELYQKSIEVINKIRKLMSHKKNPEKEINLAYLEVVTLKFSGEYRKALDKIEDSLESLPIQEQDIDSFLHEKNQLLNKMSSR